MSQDGQTSGVLWNTEPKWQDAVSGPNGDPYFMASVGSVAQYPSVIKKMFITTEFNWPGIYLMQFYVRGKPWYVDVDDSFLFDGARGSKEDQKLYFAQAGNDKTLWAPILEKGWAKVKGAYSHEESLWAGSGLRAITGAPVMTEDFYSSGKDPSQTWSVMRDADNKQWPMNVGAKTNSCGLPENVSFSVMAVFMVYHAELIMMRFPNGNDFTSYNRRWNYRDTEKWTPEALKQVPYGIDPTTAYKQGIFFVDSLDLFSCFRDLNVAHLRDDEGYHTNWYDQQLDWGFEKILTVTPKSGSGDLYFSVESYYSSQLPPNCSSGVHPTVTVELAKGGKVVGTIEKQDEDRVRPLIVKEGSYRSGDVFTWKITYDWKWAPERDFTATVYSKQDVDVRDERFTTYQWYMDGDTPNGFTTLWNPFRTQDIMNGIPSTKTKPLPFGPKCLTDTFRGANDFGHWFEVYFSNFWLIWWWYCW